MQKRCQICRKKVSGDLFICPHCGAILGEPVLRPVPVRVPRQKLPRNKKHRNAPFLGWLPPVLLILLLICVVFILPKHLNYLLYDLDLSTTEPTQTTSTPLVTYHVQVKGGSRSTLSDVQIEVYLGDALVQTCITGDYGKASFTLPENDNYRLRLRNLPLKYSYYNESDFTFQDGQQELVITLEQKPITYTVKVVDRQGNPVPGADILIYCAKSHVQTTGADGTCSVQSRYVPDGYFARIVSLPAGYYSEQMIFDFERDSTQLVITLLTPEDLPAEGKTIYTVYVVDEYGQPVANIDLQYYIYVGSVMVKCYGGTTNGEGTYAFLADIGYTPRVIFQNHPDYSSQYFTFEPGSNELRIELELHKTEFTYTVYVIDPDQNPLPGITLHYLDPYDPNHRIASYTSDEQGVITFTCSEPDPTKVVLIWEMYPGSTMDIYYYRFESDRRTTTAVIYHGTLDEEDIIYG